MTSRFYLIQLTILVLVTLGTGLALRSTMSAGFAGSVLLLSPVLLYLRCRQSARAYAPPGFTLGLGLGATHLALRHAVATTVTSYASWQSVVRRGDAVVLRTRRGGVLPLPAELVAPALEQLRALVEGPEERPLRQPESLEALPYAYECTSATRGRLARAALTRQLLTPGMLTLIAVDLLLLVSPLFARGFSSVATVFPVGATLALIGFGWWTTRRRLAACASPGMVVRAGLRDDALVLDDATGRATIPYRGVDRIHVMRHAVLIRSQLRSTILFPRAVLPDAELRRAQGAVEWFRSRR
jgi:hypothetical protein